MSPFPASILITLALYVSVLVAIWYSWRGIRRILRYTRRHSEALRWIAWPAFGLFIIGITASDSLTIFFSILIFAPFAIILLIQFAFWIYHAIAHGDAMYEAGTHRGTRTIYVTEKKKPKLTDCPICKRKSRCKVQKSPAGFYFHIQRG